MQTVNDKTQTRAKREQIANNYKVGRSGEDLMFRRRKTKKMHPGMFITRQKHVTLSGHPVSIPDPAQFVHLQFRRFAGCPVCNLYLQSMVRRHNEIRTAAIREVVVFHSTAEEVIHE